MSSDYFSRLAAKAVAAGSTPNRLHANPGMLGGLAFDADRSTEELTPPPLPHHETSTIVQAPAPASLIDAAPGAQDAAVVIEHDTTINHVHDEPSPQPPVVVAEHETTEIRQLPPDVIRVVDRVTTHEHDSHSATTNTTVVVEPQAELAAPPPPPAEWRASFPERLTTPAAPTIEIRVNRIVVKGDERTRRAPIPTSAAQSSRSNRGTHAVDLADYLERRSGQ